MQGNDERWMEDIDEEGEGVFSEERGGGRRSSHRGLMGMEKVDYVKLLITSATNAMKETSTVSRQGLSLRGRRGYVYDNEKSGQYT